MAKYENKKPYEPPCGYRVGSVNPYECDSFIVRDAPPTKDINTRHRIITRINETVCRQIRCEKKCIKNCPPDSS